MEVIKKTILQVLTTGITATTSGNKYIIIPDTGATYSMTFGIVSSDEEIGFFDAYTFNDPYYYYDVSGDTNMAKFESMLSGGTGVPPILYDSGGYATTDEFTGDTVTYVEVTGTSLSRLSELRKYTITNVFSKQYITGGTTNVDGVDVAVSNTGSSITYYLSGIKYIDVISGASSGITYNIFTPQGITSANFIDVPYYKNPNKENIISQPNIDDDVFIVRQETSAFENNYRLEYIKNLSDLITYAGGNYFNIINNS